MKYLPIKDLVIPESRQRIDFEPNALQELSESIRAKGLMHPIVVRNGNTLVAGERRIRAISDMRALHGNCLVHDEEIVPDNCIPVVDLGDLDPLAAEEAELDENTKRKDLTWQENASAVARLHALRSAQAARRGEIQSVADTAEEVTGRRDGDYQNKTRQQIIVADHLSNPAIAKAKDVKEAFKILRREEDTKNNVILAETVGRNYSASSHTLVHGDCIQWMDDADPDQFDCILTDPPYGMSADDFGDGAGRLAGITHAYKDDGDSFVALMEGIAPRISRVARTAAHLYICCDIDKFFYLRSLFAKHGWNVFRTPLINYKTSSGRVPLPEHGPRRCYETILYAFRGAKRTTAIYPDVIGTAGDENLGHGAQKPIALYTDLLRRSTRPGDRVFDPFAGTGTIFPAAHQLRLFATGVEKEAGYYGIAVKRLKGVDSE